MNDLPFQFSTRAQQLESVSEERRSALMEDRDRELEDYLSRLATTPWTNFTLLNSWTTTAAQVPQYRKVGDMVHVRIHTVGGTNGSIMATLPVGFRPPSSFDAPAVGYTNIGGYELVGAYVQSNGNIALGWTAGPTWNSISTAFQFSVTP